MNLPALMSCPPTALKCLNAYTVPTCFSEAATARYSISPPQAGHDGDSHASSGDDARMEWACPTLCQGDGSHGWKIGVVLRKKAQKQSEEMIVSGFCPDLYACMLDKVCSRDTSAARAMLGGQDVRCDWWADMPETDGSALLSAAKACAVDKDVAGRKKRRT